jgi:hypothetical protein
MSGSNKSLYLTDDVLQRLSREKNPSRFVVNLVRRQMAIEEDRQNQDRTHGPITEERRSQIRDHMRGQMRKARKAIDTGAYDELRQQLGMMDQDFRHAA